MTGIAGSYQQLDGADLGHRMSRGSVRPRTTSSYAYQGGGVSLHLDDSRAGTSGSHREPIVKDGLTLSYTGTLYNCRELRSELRAQGVTFLAEGEAEVLLEAWRRWGVGCLRRFRGMFAIAVFEEATGSLFLGRDQLGIKPLHYLRRHGGVVFASELNSLATALSDEVSVDPGALVASMFYGWVPDRRCSIRGVEKLEPGTWARFDPDGTYRYGRYWDIAEVVAAAAAGPPIELREALEGSVAAHLSSGSPVTSLLSGGLDSSLVTALAQRSAGGLDACTVRFGAQRDRFDAFGGDAVYARRMAERLGIRLQEIEISPGAIDLVQRLTDTMSEPVGDPAAIGQWLIFDAAADAGAKVMLSGLGADELFGGYRKHVACMLSSHYQRLPLAARDAVNSVVMNLPISGGRRLRHIRWAKQFLSFSELPEEAAFRRSYSLYDPVELLALLGGDFAPHVGDLVGEHLEIYWDNQLPDPVNRMCLADARHFLPGLNLAYADRASAAASTEIRLPFVDPVVLRAAFSVAGDQKVRGMQGKVALKQAARAWLPADIVNRPRRSFSVPIRAWLDRELRGMVSDVLLDGLLVASGFLRREALHRLVAAHRSGHDDRSKHIWHLLMLELWYRRAATAGIGL